MPAFDPTLCLVVDPDHCFPLPAETVVIQGIAGGVTLVQLRSKTASARTLVALGKTVKAIVRRFQVPLLVNDRVDIALAIQADGVHLGQTDLHPIDAKKILGKRALIGFSVSNTDQARSALGLPIDYLGVGPIFKTETKTDFSRLTSPTELREICGLSPHPIIGIGGVNGKNAAALREAGASGIAVVSAICRAANPKKAAQALRKTWKGDGYPA